MHELVAKVEHTGGPLTHGRSFLEHLALLNRAVHGLDVAPEDSVRTAEIGAERLAS